MDPVPLETRWAPGRWSWRRIPAIGAVFILLIAALAAHDVWRSHRVAVAQTERELDMQARVIADQSARSVQAIDLVLRHVAEGFRSGSLAALGEDALRAHLRDQTVGLLQLNGLLLVDAGGRSVATGDGPAGAPWPAADADRETFEALRRGPDPRVHIGQARPGALGQGDWVIPVSRRLQTASGAFAGVVVAEARIGYFSDFYRTVRTDGASRISLVHHDGTLLARYPPLAPALGQPFALFDTLLTSGPDWRASVSRVVSPVDGVDRFAALQMVPDYPLAIIVARDATAALAAWREQAIGSAWRTLALGLLAALLLALFRAQFVRLDRTRASLEVSQERFALAAAGADVGIWDWDLRGDCVYASQRAREIFGLGQGPEVRSRGDWFAAVDIHPDDREGRRRAIDAHFAGETPAYEHEFRVRGADGAYRWVRVSALCVRDAAGAAMRMAGSVADVDGPKRAEEALRLSEERYALAMTGSTGGHWVWEVDSDALFVSPTMNLMFGLPADTEAGTRRDYFRRVPVHADDWPRMRELGRAVREGQTGRVDFEYRVTLPGSGEQRWILTRAQCFRDANGKAVRVAGVSVDVSERKRTEEALRLSEQRFALAVAGSNDGIVDWDMVNDRMYTSERTMQMLGIDSDQTTRTRAEWMALLRLHPDDEARHRDELRRFIDSGELLREGEYRILRGDGCRWVRLRNLCVRDAAGRPLRLTGSVSDIDAYKRVEAALRESEERYALAMTGSNEGHWVWDLVKDEIYASAKLSELIGGPAEPRTLRHADYLAQLPVHPQDRVRLQQARDEHVAGVTPRLDVEFRIVLPGSGELRWLHSRGQCFRADDGRPLRVAGSTVDATRRKQAEDRLRNSEERYALAVAGSDDGVWDWDFHAGLAFESARARELQGLPPGPELQPLDELIASLRVHPDDAALRAEGLRAHLAGETPAYECEYRVRHADGAYRWIRVRAVCIRNAQGEACRMAGSISDIDARRAAEQRLRDSEQRFALAVAGTNDGILDWDIVNDRMYVSERALCIVGIEPGTPVRTRADWEALLMPRLHPDDARRLTDELVAAPRSVPHSHDGEYRVRQADGNYRWTRFRGMSVVGSEGRAIRWAGSVSDIDRAKRTEQALRRSEERYALAVAGSSEGLWDWDLASDSLFLSARAQELLWVAPGEPQRPRREWIALTHYHPDDRPRVRRAIAEHLKGATAHYEVEYRLQHHSGRWHWYRQRGVAVRDAEGRPTRMAGSMEDISERKNFELERDRLESELRQAQKLEAIGTLAGGIAHDFNNILAAILGYGEMAQKDAPEGSAQRRHIDAAISAGMRAKSLVERILAFSRTGVAERVPVHVASVVTEALDQVAASLPAGIVLERRLCSGDAALLGDPTQVHQVVMNLCANAVQSMRSAGTLTVTLDLLGDGHARCAVGAPADTPSLRLRVQDTGAGMHASVLERIFDPFFTTKEIGVGTGLGLSLVHGIVTDLGGVIEVESELGRGATFTVHLPWQSCVTLPAAAAPSLPPGGHGETILLVDDEEALVRLGEEIVAGLGYEPVGFTSGVQALEALRADPDRFQAVLSDESMPEMTGSELARDIRALRPELPVVLMSGYVSSALTARARAAGVREVLAKPLAAAEIARCLARVLAPGAATHDEPAGATV